MSHESWWVINHESCFFRRAGHEIMLYTGTGEPPPPPRKRRGRSISRDGAGQKIGICMVRAHSWSDGLFGYTAYTLSHWVVHWDLRMWDWELMNWDIDYWLNYWLILLSISDIIQISVSVSDNIRYQLLCLCMLCNSEIVHECIMSYVERHHEHDMRVDLCVSKLMYVDNVMSFWFWGRQRAAARDSCSLAGSRLKSPLQ